MKLFSWRRRKEKDLIPLKTELNNDVLRVVDPDTLQPEHYLRDHNAKMRALFSTPRNLRGKWDGPETVKIKTPVSYVGDIPEGMDKNTVLGLDEYEFYTSPDGSTARYIEWVKYVQFMKHSNQLKQMYGLRRYNCVMNGKKTVLWKSIKHRNMYYTVVDGRHVGHYINPKMNEITAIRPSRAKVPAVLTPDEVVQKYVIDKDKRFEINENQIVK